MCRATFDGVGLEVFHFTDGVAEFGDGLTNSTEPCCFGLSDEALSGIFALLFSCTCDKLFASDWTDLPETLVTIGGAGAGPGGGASLSASACGVGSYFPTELVELCFWLPEFVDCCTRGMDAGRGVIAGVSFSFDSDTAPLFSRGLRLNRESWLWSRVAGPLNSLALARTGKGRTLTAPGRRAPLRGGLGRLSYKLAVPVGESAGDFVWGN